MDNVNTMNTNAASLRGISGFHLKVIAVISMFIDHLGATLVLSFLNATYAFAKSGKGVGTYFEPLFAWTVDHWKFMVSVYEGMRYIGRIAFPIYCFLIVEGFLHTKNVAKYALRLGIFALISEIPFDLAFNEGWWDPYSNNVFFTLLIGLLVIWGISYIRERCGAFYQEELIAEDIEEGIEPRKRNEILRKLCVILVGLACTGVGAFIAKYILHTDYGAAGVITIVVMYLLHKKQWMGYVLAVLVLTLMTNSSEMVAMLGAVLVCYYKGERGKNIKYFFYAFYPVHLLVLWLVTIILGL